MSISSSSPVSRYLGSGSFQRRLPRERQPDFIVAAGGGKAREPDRESFFYPCSPKNFPKETPTFKLFSFSLSLTLSFSLLPKKNLYSTRASRARTFEMVSRWWKPRRDFSFPKIHPLLSPFSSPDNSPSFPHPSCSVRHESLSLSLSSSSFIYVFSSGYKCPRLGIASCFGNEESLPSCCPIPWACLEGQRVESNGIGWIFLSTFVSREREEEKKRDVGWRASLEPRGFFHSRRVVLWGGSFSGGGFRWGMLGYSFSLDEGEVYISSLRRSLWTTAG